MGDVASYLEIAEVIQNLGLPSSEFSHQPMEVQVAPDATWVEKRTKQIQAETDRLEAELKIYRNNMIKESIRVCVLHATRYSFVT